MALILHPDQNVVGFVVSQGERAIPEPDGDGVFQWSAPLHANGRPGDDSHVPDTPSQFASSANTGYYA